MFIAETTGVTVQLVRSESGQLDALVARGTLCLKKIESIRNYREKRVFCASLFLSIMFTPLTKLDLTLSATLTISQVVATVYTV